MSQVLSNLLKNSLAVVKDGGKIRIICNKLENKNIKITVKDNGPGLTTDKIEQINANLTKMDEIKEKKVQ